MADFTVLECLSLPGGVVNEDATGHVGGAAWILDGATGVAPARLLPGASDAAWLVEAVDAWLRAELHRFADFGTGARALQQAVDARFRMQALGDDREPAHQPSASFALAELRAGWVGLWGVGDCRLLVRGNDGRIHRFGSSSVRGLDDRVLARLAALQQQGLAYDAAWAEVRRDILANRSVMNTAGGYWVLDCTSRWLPHLERAQFPAVDTGHLLLMTDGFYRLSDTFGQYDDRALFEVALAHGLDVLARELRTFEDQDRECRRWPRLKPSDDATAVLAKIG